MLYKEGVGKILTGEHTLVATPSRQGRLFESRLPSKYPRTRGYFALLFTVSNVYCHRKGGLLHLGRMENMDKIIVTEHDGVPEGATEFAFNDEAQLQEKLESLRIEHIEALQNNNGEEAKKIEEKINFIEEQLGLNEAKDAA